MRYASGLYANILGPIAALALLAALAGYALSHDGTPSQRCFAGYGLLPDPICTPGAVNPDVTQDNLADTICKPGWTATVRPPVSYTSPLKRQSMKDYGLTIPAYEVEFDHLIPLELGGAPRDPKNLWAEAGASPNEKDTIERRMNRYVCSGNMSLKDAQEKIAANWLTADP